jgi:DNA-binding winged helix-turn-helix (wHTH) protein/Tol biopolymer transport system component
MSAAGRIRIGSWVASPALNLLENGGRSVKLEPRTMDVLAHLARRPGEVVSVEELLASVWQGVVVGEGSVYHAIKQLRQAFGADGTRYIETIPKRGYRLTAPVEELLPAEVASAVVSDARRIATSPPARATVQWRATAAIVAVVAVLAAVAGRWSAAPRLDEDAEPHATRFAIQVPALLASPSSIAVSPDGRHLAYVAGDSAGRALLHVRPLDAFEARALTGTEGATMPFWSPNGQEIGFRAGSELKRVALIGGEPRRIADVGAAPLGTATWSSNGDILFDGGTGIERVAAAGGNPAHVTTLEPGEGAHALPQFLPGGRSFLFTSAFKEPFGVFAQSLDSDQRVRVSPIAGLATYASGYLLLNQADGTLTAQPFDLERLELRGEPVRLAEDVAGFSASGNGVLAYVEGLGALFRPPTAVTQLAWYDRVGRRLGSAGEPGAYRGIALSPDGRYVAVHHHEALEVGDILVLDQERGMTGGRRTLNRAHNLEPVWSRDGTRIVYTGASFNLYQAAAAGNAPEQLLHDSLRFAFATDWSADGETVLVTHVPPSANQTDVAAVAIADGRVTALLTSEFNEAAAKFSPDGHWIAYNSNESGRSEVYVRAYPRAEGQTRISAEGGFAPLWSRDGRELFYLTADGTLMAAGVQTGQRALTAETPRPLFTASFAVGDHLSVLGPLFHMPYAVHPDGERFLVNERSAAPPAATARAGAGGGGTRAATIAVVVDWMAGLER